ncbi:PEP-utilizing enzyme [Streptosporangium sp. NPDC051022]|uniref:PEP-utilizing enzyme n=1 Tax=Streptosporangium sp. NPDC051022 TaxID=3155752 RepID=UPI0034227C07
MSGEVSRFPFFHEAPAPEGAEGWESMYPYYLLPREETRAWEDSILWFADTMHWSRGVHPFDSIGAEAVYLGAGQNSARIFVLPTSLGLDVRVQNGYVYIAGIPVTDPAEIERRAALFQERAGFYYANWDELYAKWKTKVTEAVAGMKTISFPPLGELDPIEVVTEARGRSTSWDIIANYHRLIDEFFLVWQYHFEFLNLGYGGYIVFFQFCKQAFPQITEQEVARLVAGVDVLAFRPDDELRKLAQMAADLDLVGVLSGAAPAADKFSALAQSENGEVWLKAYRSAQDPWFNYFAEYGFTHDQDTWNSNPEIPLQGIARYAARIQAGEDITRPVERLSRERDEIVAEYRNLLSPEEQAQFDELLGLARKVFPFIEEHNIYVEHWTHTVFWEKVWELGDFLVSVGFATERDDVFYLNRFELDEVLADIVQSWAIGVEIRGKKKWADIIARRRPIVAALQSHSAPPAYGIPPEEVTDPFAVMNYGVTTDRIKEWLGASSGSSSTLTGIPGGPGVVEGPVRVLRTEKDLALLQPGEILVAAITAPSWAAAFSVATGVVTDIGGMMSHAAIVCREYGVPAVVGTGFATANLKTGQRVRVDGDTGTVTVLEDVQ